MSVEARWLLGGLVLAFAIPFLSTDLILATRATSTTRSTSSAVFGFVGGLGAADAAAAAGVPHPPLAVGCWRSGCSAGIVLVFTVLREPVDAASTRV